MSDPPPLRLSVELVPRDEDTLRQDLALIRRVLPSVATVNIPDLPRFPVRSWTGCTLAREWFPHAIPHLRAADFTPETLEQLDLELQRHHLDELLVVTGDPQEGQPATGITALAMIRQLKAGNVPGRRVYAAVDPYRNGFQTEQAYIERKLEAGADGFFTQPFFDLRLLAIYLEILANQTVFWGISPVVGTRSQAYWQERNQVVFPASFQPTLAWNRQFAREAMTLCRAAGTPRGAVYFMPIRIDLADYFTGLLDP